MNAHHRQFESADVIDAENSEPSAAPSLLALEADQEQRTCEHCGNAFSPRSGSGGRPQKFCSPECRLAFHQRDQHNPTYGAPTSPQAPELPKPKTATTAAPEAPTAVCLQRRTWLRSRATNTAT
jgi:hypothetical protein